MEDFYIRIKTQALKCKYASEDVTRENPGTVHSRNGHPKSPVGAPIKGWYPHSSTGIRHGKGTWGEHQAHEADTRQIPTPVTSTIDAVSNNRSHKQCGNWWRSCTTKVTSIWYNMLPVPKEDHWCQVCRSGSSGTANMGGGQAAHAKASTKQMKRRWWSSCHHGHRRQAINIVTDDSSGDLASGLECLEFSSFEKNSSDNRDELHELDIQYKRSASLRVKVNTGAQGNILLLRIFRQMFPEKLNPNGYPAEGTTKKRQTILQVYNGTTIKQLGVVTLIANTRTLSGIALISLSQNQKDWWSWDCWAAGSCNWWQYTAWFRWQRRQLPSQSTMPWTLSVYI